MNGANLPLTGGRHLRYKPNSDWAAWLEAFSQPISGLHLVSQSRVGSMSSLTATELRPKLTGQRTHRGRVWFALYLVFLFVTFAGLGTAHDDFPLGFHPDEPSKVVQLESGQFNFYHPQLMLSLTRVGVAVTGADTAQQMVEVGRTVSALLSAGAVVALTLAVAMLFGYLPAVAAGLLLLQSYPLLTAAHYMKEDPALLFGMSVTMVAVIWFWRSPSRWWAVLLGAAAALAVSGKYIGAVMIPVAVFTIWVATQEDRRAMRKPLLLSAAGGVCGHSAVVQWLGPAATAQRRARARTRGVPQRQWPRGNPPRRV